MKLGTIAVLLLAAVNSAYAEPDGVEPVAVVTLTASAEPVAMAYAEPEPDSVEPVAVATAYAEPDSVAIKEQKIAEEVRTAAANLEKAEKSLEKKQNGLRGTNKPAGVGPKKKADEIEDNDEVEYLNGTPMQPKCSSDICPRKNAAFKKALHDYDVEKLKDYDPYQVKYLNGVPIKDPCDESQGDKYERKKCAHRHRAYERAEEKHEEDSFKGRGPSDGKPVGGRGPPEGKPAGGRGKQ
jgi:hypothetical protein